MNQKFDEIQKKVTQLKAARMAEIEKAQKGVAEAQEYQDQANLAIVAAKKAGNISEITRAVSDNRTATEVLSMLSEELQKLQESDLYAPEERKELDKAAHDALEEDISIARKKAVKAIEMLEAARADLEKVIVGAKSIFTEMNTHPIKGVPSNFIEPLSKDEYKLFQNLNYILGQPVIGVVMEAKQ